MSAVNTFGLPLSAPSLTLTDAAGLVTDAVTADAVTTPLVRSASPTAGTGAAGVDLQIAASSGATSAGTAGGVGGDLELFAGSGGSGTAAANGGSVILRPGNGFAPGVSGLVRVETGPLLTTGAIFDLGVAAAVNITVTQLRGGLLFGTPGLGATYNVPSGADLVQQLPGIKVGDIIRFSVANLSGVNTIDLGGAPVTVGNLQVAASQSGAFALIATNVSSGTEAFTLYRISS